MPWPYTLLNDLLDALARIPLTRAAAKSFWGVVSLMLIALGLLGAVGAYFFPELRWLLFGGSALIFAGVLGFAIAVLIVQRRGGVGMPKYKCGYSGGTGGGEFTDDYIGDTSKVVEIRVSHGRVIEGIQIAYEMSDGTRHPLRMHGGAGGPLEVFTLHRDEYITGIGGRYGDFVDSLQIRTNKQRTTHFGGNGGTADYVYEAPEGTEIVGFCGRSGDVIDAIGVILRARPSPS
jgi:hypothetical protein